MLGYRTTDAIMHGPALGSLTESAVVSELTKVIHHGGRAAQLYHWEGLSAEVDIVADVDGHLYGIEVKATRTPDLPARRQPRPLLRAHRDHPHPSRAEPTAPARSAAPSARPRGVSLCPEHPPDLARPSSFTG